MGSSLEWKDKTTDYHTVYYFRRANRKDPIGGICIKGVFHWFIALSLFENWVQDGGYVTDDDGREFALDQFVDLTNSGSQIVQEDLLAQAVDPPVPLPSMYN